MNELLLSLAITILIFVVFGDKIYKVCDYIEDAIIRFLLNHTDFDS